jgi:hypothetical protein
MINRILFFVFWCANAYSQLLSVGVEGGTPLSESTSSGMVGNRSIGGGLSTLNARRYTVGPTFEVALPLGLRFEAEALYKHLDRTEHYFLGPTYGTIMRVAANPWEFPLLLKYSPGRGRYRPFADAGGTFRCIESLDGSTEMFAGGLDPPYSVVRYHLNYPLIQGGMAFGGGLRIKLVGRWKITPEIRYTRWTSRDLLPTRNQVDLLLGIGGAAVR